MNDLAAVAVISGSGVIGYGIPFAADYWRKHGHRKDSAGDHSGTGSTEITFSANTGAFQSAIARAGSYSFSIGGQMVPTGFSLNTPSPQPETVPEVAPDLIEPIIALRAWKVTSDGYLLAANRGTRWPARQPINAICNQRSMFSQFGMTLGGIAPLPEKPTPHISPSAMCHCGIYAAKEKDKMVYGDGVFAWGRVAMWGRVIEGEHGYRSQYAYPVSIVLVNRRSDEVPRLDRLEIEEMRERVATHYGVPVRIGSLTELDTHTDDEWESMGLPEQVRDIVG